MKNFLTLVCLSVLFLSSTVTAFADFKLRQQVTTGVGRESFTQERAVWVKGARERTENKFVGDERVAQMMPQIAEVRQCDLRQTLKINDRAKRYFIEPFYETDDKPLPPAQPGTKTEIVKGGAVTMTYTLTDTGERRQMFGLTARHLIIKQVSEVSKDSCAGESKMSITEDGWFVYLIPETARCSIEIPRFERKPTRQCRDRIVMKGVYRYPGMMLEGTTKMVDLLRNNEFTSLIKTLELSKETLAMSLFEIPVGYSHANSEQSLMDFGIGDVFGGANGTTPPPPTTPTTAPNPSRNRKSIAVDFFSGNVSKINQMNLRQYLAGQISASGANGVPVTSPNEIASGAFANVVGVEIKSVKESGASKLGGIFGKVTGSEDASKIGKSEAEIILTLYDRDGKIVIAVGTAKEKVDGKADDAVKAALDRALAQVLPKLK